MHSNTLDKIFQIYQIIIVISILLFIIIGPIILITTCNSKLMNKCIMYDTFHGSIYAVNIETNYCPNLLNNNICYTGYVYASTNSETKWNNGTMNQDDCRVKMIGPTISLDDVNVKLSSYKYGQSANWIKDSTNNCHNSDSIFIFITGIVFTVFFTGTFLLFISIKTYNNGCFGFIKKNKKNYKILQVNKTQIYNQIDNTNQNTV